MSPTLWEVADRIAAKIDPASGDPIHTLMAAIARYVDGHFFHLSQQDVSDIWGLVGIEAEAAGPREREVRYTLDLIMGHNDERVTLTHGGDERRDLAPFVARGLFPEYLYTNLDIVHANRRVLLRKKHKPFGITSCADEAILIASLACALDGVSADEVLVMGSPEHYSALVRHHGQRFWFNAKREFFDTESWAREVRTNAGGDPQAAFDMRLKTLDRVITPQGTFFFHDRRSTLTPTRWRSIREDLAGFFGIELRQIAQASATEVAWADHPLADVPLTELDDARSPQEARSSLRSLASRHPGSALEAAFYGFRNLDVRHPHAYVRSALREHKTREAASAIATLADAVEIVRAVADDTPILGDRDRLALPDEVLLLKPGSDREKALLLYALLHHGQANIPAPEFILTDHDSYVRAGEDLIGLRSLDKRPEVLD